ncbi:MAG: hypothetical protein IT581_01135 [Verrucomicrobiales bacterium]|nr:hypothetical protein [Verrucomicrobiales bacterium]
MTLRSFATLLRLDLSFTPGTLYAFMTNLTPSNYPDAPSVNRFYEALFHRISTLPGVDSVGGAVRPQPSRTHRDYR